jgi:TetR/AcrR family transcriptional regulator, transcriptional repressor for nem operon
MRSSLDQRTQVRRRIVESATQLFNRHGFASVSIDEIMAGAGLTRGGFYNYFQSKAELYAEAVTSFVKDKPTANGAGQARDHAGQIVRAYLALQHFESVETSCPLIGLPNDPSKGNRSVREAQEAAVRTMVEIFEHGVASEAKPTRQRALALASLCVGGMVLGRTIEDRLLADELREATMAIAFELGKLT